MIVAVGEHGAAGTVTVGPGVAVAVAVAEGSARHVSEGTGRVAVGPTAAGPVVVGVRPAVGPVAVGEVALAPGITAVEDAVAVCTPGVIVGGLSMDAGVEPGWVDAAVTGLTTATAEDPAGRGLFGADAGRAEAGRAVTPWR